ncbi:MAG: hypothetical protein SCH98_04495 [Deferrisomatales bacterium]|nr:hypothetical protein [Deferrisomatales bacterium]
MKQPPHLVRAQARMAPGVLTMDGFLGTDPRDLVEILEDDEGAVRRLGLRHDQLAAALQGLTAKAVGGFGAPVREGVFLLCAQEAMGVLPCPFGEPGLHPKAVVEATRSDTGERLSWTALQVHLIGQHGFYEGRGSPYRLEPATLARFLEVEPEQP